MTFLKKFSERFEELNVLGEGTVGLVKKCMEKSTRKFYAVKIVRTTDEEILENMINEFNHLKNV